MMDSIDIATMMSAVSMIFTAYFWFVKARRDRPNLQFYQLGNFRTSLRRHPELDDRKRFSIQQLDTGGVLIVNHSTRQNSVVLFECVLHTDSGDIVGEWGYTGDDKPPWNIGPESTVAFSPACFFDVPAEFEQPLPIKFTLNFLTASGRCFEHGFTEEAPVFAQTDTQSTRRAA